MNVLIPAIIVPGLILTPLALYPWIEQRATGDRREHHTLDRPRNVPVRTGIGAAFITFYLLLWIAGGNDFFATILHIPINWITRFIQVGLIVLPPLVFWITKRACLGLQRRSRDTVLHGRESGVIQVSPVGEFSERHSPLEQGDAYALTAHERHTPFVDEQPVDANGIPNPAYRENRTRARLSKFYFADVIPKPTAEEIREAQAHGNGHHAIEAGDDGAQRDLAPDQQ